MMTPFKSVESRFGRIKEKSFTPSCTPGDWVSFGKTTFATPFPDFRGFDVPPVVIVSPRMSRDRAPNPNSEAPAVVPIVSRFDSKGFELVARNADCVGGSVGFDWMALAAYPEGDHVPRAAMAQVGLTPPQHFQIECQPGDWKTWKTPSLNDELGRARGGVYVFSTATDANATPMPPTETPWSSYDLELYGSCTPPWPWLAQPLDLLHAPVTGFTHMYWGGGMAVRARNTGFEGNAACNFLVAAPERSEDPRLSSMSVDSGFVTSKFFAPKQELRGGQWQTWDIYFSDPFIAPPVVLLTANAYDRKGSRTCAPVGIVSRVNPYYFTIAARNSDCAAGEAGFNYVAFGCPQCGSR
jgi:hypothetical protein